MTAAIVAALPWPNWRQALTFTIVCTVGWQALVLLRSRVPRHSRRVVAIASPALREMAIIGGLYTLWRLLNKLPLQRAGGAMARGRSIHDFQQAIGLPSEVGINHFLLHHSRLGWLASAYYVIVHVPATVAFLVWMFWRHRERYAHWRNVLAITTGACILIRFWRVAPPRFFPEYGFVDITVLQGMDVYGPVGTGVSGQFVAMPSIHVAWAAVVAFGVLSASTSRWRWLVATHLPVTLLVVAGTSHHWWLDGIVATLIVLAAMVIDDRVALWSDSIRRARDDAAEPAEPDPRRQREASIAARRSS